MSISSYTYFLPNILYYLKHTPAGRAHKHKAAFSVILNSMASSFGYIFVYSTG